MRPAVIYDGECPFCRAQATRLKRRDRDDRIDFLPFPSLEIEDRFPQLRGMDIDLGMRFVTPDGRVFTGADAVHRIALELPRWRWVAWLYHVPGVRRIARSIYAWVAKRRHRLGPSKTCRDGVCGVE